MLQCSLHDNQLGLSPYSCCEAGLSVRLGKMVTDNMSDCAGDAGQG